MMFSDLTTDAGTDWPQNLPATWRAVELKRVTEVSASNVDKHSAEGETPVALCNYTDVYYNEYIIPGMDFMRATATIHEIRRFGLRGGEVLLTKDSETATDIAVPAFVQPGLDGVVCGYHLYVLRPKPREADGRYLMRALSVPPVRDQFVVAANGITRYGLGQQDLGSSVVPLPPLTAQRAIADFLDRKTAQIDDLTAKKQYLLELLAEKRTALITQAVTKGLDPDVEMKDSGVEWLGEIPAHWDTTSLRYVTRDIDQGWSPVADDRRATDVEWGVLKLSAISRGTFLEEQHKTLPDDLKARPGIMVKQGDVLVSRANTPERVGDACYVRGTPSRRLMMSDLIYRITLDGAADAEFVTYWLISTVCRQQIESAARGSSLSMVKISQASLGSLTIVLPPPDEQRLIRDYLNQATANLSGAIRKVREAIELLSEYRTALISAAVTGQIDVREASP